MKAFVLLPLLPIDLVRKIQQFLAHSAANTIIRAYYRKVIFKVKLAEYFCSIRSHMYVFGYYKINILPTFVNNLRLASRFISDNDDSWFWGAVYINIQKTLAHEETLRYPELASYNEVDNLCNDLRLSIGGYLTYHS
tara:strand:+ start:225 stop:635 length:411 start_codon:yes stop_codon:yes gene_type:complete